MRKVIVTSAGTSTATNILLNYSNRDDIEFITTDINPIGLIASPHLVKSLHFKVPLATEEIDYAKIISQIALHHKVDLIYPINDSEILTLSKHSKQYGIDHLLPNYKYKDLESINDKYECYLKCKENGIPVPETFLSNMFDPNNDLVGFKIVVKPRRGVGSKGVQILNDRNIEVSNANYIVQRRILGAEYTVDVVSVPGFFGSIVRERIEVKSGVCTKAKVFYSEYVNDIAKELADKMGLSGLFCFQFIGDIKSCEIYITDINPRPGGGTALTAKAGFNLYNIYFGHTLGFIQDINDAVDEWNEGLENSKEKIVCRYFNEVVTCVDR